jgi:hypothetical protein
MNKPTKQASIAECEATLAAFEQQRTELIGQQEQRTALRREVSFAAHAGDPEAARQLDAMHDEAARHQSRLASISDAINEARRRLQQAHEAEAKAFDREKAKKLRECLVAFAAASVTLDDCLALLITAGDAMRANVTEMNRLGLSHPSHNQLDSLGGIVLRSSLMQTPWSRHFERVGPLERRKFADLLASWSLMIERRITELEQINEHEAA